MKTIRQLLSEKLSQYGLSDNDVALVIELMLLNETMVIHIDDDVTNYSPDLLKELEQSAKTKWEQLNNVTSSDLISPMEHYLILVTN